MTTPFAPELTQVPSLAALTPGDQESVRTLGFDESSEGRRILAAAGEILGQGEALLGMLSAENYVRKLPAAFNGTIGGHIRHCLDHFSQRCA